MPSESFDLILEELRDLRADMNDGFKEVLQRTTAVETHTEPFFANGGGLAIVQRDIEGLKRTKYMVVGAAGVLTTAGHWLLHKLGV